MEAGEIYLAMFPFSNSPGMKLRPVLTLTGPIGAIPEVLVAYISSVIPASPLPTDIVIDPSLVEHKSANLKVASVLRLYKLATIHTHSLARRLGILPFQLKPEVSTKLKLLLKL